MKMFYLALAVVGTLVPYVFFAEFFANVGLAPGAFVAALFTNGAAGGITADVVISSLAFWAWLVAERAPRIWLYVALNLLIGLSCALPAYLYYRTAVAPQRSAAYSG